MTADLVLEVGCEVGGKGVTSTRRGPPPPGDEPHPPVPDHRAGLCSVCRHHRLTGNRRGSRFYLCELSTTDPRFSRYPPLPVLRCEGFEREEPGGWDEFADDA